jgi:outer membrane autotransporter protein
MIAESGTTSMNVNLDDNYNATGARTNKLVLKGNITASTGAVNPNEPELHSVVNLGLATKDSEWTGVSYNKFPEAGKATSGKTFTGAINLFLQNGATWNNEEWGAVEKSAWGAAAYTGSHITKLVGGDSAANAGVINQNDANDITVDNYSGSTMVVYNHEIVDDTTRNNADLYGNKAASITGGNFKITNAEAGSAVTLVTDRAGLNLDSGAYADKNLVNDTLDKLANKLIYTGYSDKNLSGKVSIAEGLTASSLTKSLAGGDISWYDGSKEGTTAGEGYYDYKLAYPDSQTTDSYSEAITGDSSVDKAYVETGVLKDGTHTYSFTKPSTAITVGKTLIGGGIWMPRISAAVSGGGDGHEADLDLHGNSMTIKTTSDTHTTGITAIGKGIVDVANAGKISVNAESTIAGQTAAIFVNNGGTVRIHNGDSNAMDKVLTLRAKGVNSANVAVIKAMNGLDGVQSAIAIDGLVDILADGKDGSSEAVSAVASKVDIGGGTIKAVNGAAYAIRGYGEFRSRNKAIVNVNVQKDKDGNVIGAGVNNTAIEGNIFLGGSMDEGGERAEVNVGLNTKDSYFKGDIANPNGSSSGHVNLYMGNGASWTGNNLSGSTVTAHLDSDASWTGYSTGSAMNLDMNGTGLWNNTGASSVASITGKGGVINMSGDKAGTVSVKQYGGNATLFYKHDIVNDAARAHADLYGDKAASVIGGDFKITDAAAGSTITLVTGNNGVSTTSTAYTDKNLVNDLLDKLANKLYYSGYANGNLKGYVRIAEGLTSSSITAKLRQEDISFYNADEAENAGMAEGQGHYSYNLVYPDEQVKDPMATVIDGSRESKDAYRDAGIYKDKTDTYDFTKKPATVNTDGKSDSIIHAGDNDVNVKTNDVLNINAKDGGIGMKAENGKTVTTTGNTNITAKDGTGILADKGIVKLANDTTISAGTGMEAKNGGTINAEGKANITATGNALHADGDGSAIALKDGTISGKVLAENKGTITTNGAAITGDVTAASDGTVSLVNGSTSAGVTADGGTVSTDGTTVDGFISAKNGGTASMKNGSAKGLSADKDSTITATLDKGDAKIDGNVANEGTASVNISNGAVWTGDSIGTGTTNANIGSGSIWTGASINGNTKAVIDGTWTQTGASELASLSGSGTIDKRSDNNGDLNIASYSGSNTFVYNHSIVDDSTRENAEYYGDKNGGNKAVSVSGGNINIAEAAKGSTISLMTDRAGLNVDSSFFRDKNLTNDALDKLANKLYYHGTESLTGRVGFGEGLTAPSEWKNITFKKDGQGSYDYTTIVNSLDIQYGSEETAMMKGTKSALLGSAMMWRGNNNDIQRRMGDLRLGQGETGVWARYIGGKNRYDQQNTYLNQDYDIGQAGFDKKVGDWTVGLAIDHGDGKSHYIGGRGKEKMNNLAIYGTRVSNDGRYFDVIVKTGQVKNKFDVSNEIGNRLHGDYKAWGNSISLEYGKRFVQDSGFYLDPSVEFTAGRLNGKNFTGTSDLGTLYVHQHGFNSAIGRIGFSVGRQLPKSNLYAKLALAHEFAGDFKTDFYAADGGLKSTKVDLSDTWLDMELGGSLSLGKNVYLYGTYTRTFEADMATKWRADVGVRYTF